MHVASWTLLCAAATTVGYLFPQVQASGQSWGSLFFKGQLAYAFPMALLTIGVWELTRLVWQARFVWWQRALSYIAASGGWMGVSVGYSLLIRQIAGWEALASVAGGERWSYIVFWMAVGGASVLHFYQRYRQREREAIALTLKNTQLESQLTQMQLQTLKAQLHPHFLFNTHNAIAALVRKGDRKMALKMLAALSDLLRHTLSHDHTQHVTLREELDFLQRYLDLEQIRFQGGLQVEIDVDEEAQEVLVPTMILQPLVENAIRHGIAESLEMGRLRLSGCCQEEQLHLQVYNDGPPLPEGWHLERQTGIGLRNTRERLEKHYGNHFRFEMSNVANQGVLVKLSLPIEQANGVPVYAERSTKE